MKTIFQNFMFGVLLLSALVLLMSIISKKSITDEGTGSNPNNHASGTAVSFWLTKGDESVLLQKQNIDLEFGTVSNNYSNITIDTTQTFQSIDGFGYALTGASAYLINHLSAANCGTLLKELFGNDGNSISVSYLRVSIGSSDLDTAVFSYDDMPAGQTDTNLQHFSLAPDKPNLIPVLKKILAINPGIKILGSPWSAPAWMKDNHSTVGGSLLPQYYNVYANYFVKYLQEMKMEGIMIDAITPQNEPLNPDNNPSMFMNARQQDSFIRYSLGPAFKAANITTKILLYDHNCDHPEYPIRILDDAATREFVDGSAFHLYNGDIIALTTVHNAYPAKNLYFTEQYTASNSIFKNEIKWHLRNVIIGSMRNWSRNALEWNLANDTAFAMHTPGGCTTCKGALTINGNEVTRNVSYYIVAHASKFVPAGSVRIGSNLVPNLYNVAFKTPEGRKVLIVENDGNSTETFNISFNSKRITTSLSEGAVGTYTW